MFCCMQMWRDDFISVLSVLYYVSVCMCLSFSPSWTFLILLCFSSIWGSRSEKVSDNLTPRPHSFLAPISPVCYFYDTCQRSSATLIFTSLTRLFMFWMFWIFQPIRFTWFWKVSAFYPQFSYSPDSKSGYQRYSLFSLLSSCVLIYIIKRK